MKICARAPLIIIVHFGYIIIANYFKASENIIYNMYKHKRHNLFYRGNINTVYSDLTRGHL